MSETETLGDALPREMARVRDEVMPAYLAIGPSGTFALTLMRAELDRAAKAMVSGDVAEMVRSIQSLQQFTS
jgi:hypothetical protein